jgi:hypothetical protein
MALAVTNPYTKANSTSIPAYNAGSGANRVLVVVIVCFNANPSAISYGGSAMTLADQQLDNDGWGRTKLFYLLNPPSGSNSFTITGGTASREPFFAAVITGADTTGVGTIAKATGQSAAASVSLTPVASGNLVIFGVSSGTDTAISNRSGSTLINSTISSGNGAGAMLSLPTSSTSAHTVSATTPNDFWTIVALEIKAASTSQDLSLSAISSVSETYNPRLFYVVALALIDPTGGLYAFSIANGPINISLPFKSSIVQLFPPTVKPEPIDSSMPYVDSVAILLPPSLEAVYELILPEISNVAQLFTPIIEPQPVEVVLPAIASAADIFAPLVSNGPIRVALPAIASVAVVYPFAVKRFIDPNELLLLGVG